MIAVVTLLLAVPLGYLVRSRLAASTAYAIAYLWAFVFQTLYLLLDSLGGGSGGSAPAFEAGDFPWQYGVVTLAIFAAGFGLVNLGHWLKARSSRTGTRATAASGNSAVSANIAP
jgi:hypothetical protein